MGKKTTVSFKIDHLDPMGQGVYKSDDEIFFLSGTLSPWRRGEAQISASKKNIHFGYLVSPEKLTTPSPLRKVLSVSTLMNVMDAIIFILTMSKR